MVNKNFANDWIRTADLWFQKRPLCQLSHNHCPLIILVSTASEISLAYLNFINVSKA